MPSIFPASYSTLLAEDLSSWIALRYGLNDVDCKFLVRGVSDTYLVTTTDNRFILRVYRSTHRNYPQVKAECDLLLGLKTAKVSVSYPIADLTGNPVQEFNAVEGIRYGVLFSFAKGRVVSKLETSHLQILGSEIAKFHNAGSSIIIQDSRWNFDVETTLFKSLRLLEPYFSENPDDYNWLTEAAEKTARQLEQFNPEKFSFGYCHFDFLPKNFHFDEDRLTLFDFDFFGRGWLVNDLMSFRQHLLLDVYFKRISPEAADQSFAAFIDAYRQHRSLSEEELAAIPWLSLGFWLFYMGFHTTHDEFYAFIQPNALKMRTALIREIIREI